MTDIPKPKDPTASDDPPIRETGRIDTSRRNLAKAALASPVIMTLASRPVWGDACTESALGSMTHASLEPEPFGGCQLGCPLSYWQGSDSEKWLNAGLDSTTPFGSQFTVTSSCNCLPDLAVLASPTTTLQQILSGGLPSATPIQQAIATAAQYAVVDLLNASAVLVLANRISYPGLVTTGYPRTVGLVKSVFNGIFAGLCNPTTCLSEFDAISPLNSYKNTIDTYLAGRTCPFSA